MKKKIKLLLYCPKGRVGLYDNRKKITGALENFFLDKLGYDKPPLLNGKIVGECDYEVEEIFERVSLNDSWFNEFHHTKTLKNKELSEKSCLGFLEMNKYFRFPQNTLDAVGYAIHIKNLHIFEEPKKTSEYNTYNRNGKVHIADIPIYTAPQNMMYAFDYYGNPFVLISVRPELMCKILNGECTIIVKKKVLKEML